MISFILQEIQLLTVKNGSDDAKWVIKRENFNLCETNLLLNSPDVLNLSVQLFFPTKAETASQKKSRVSAVAINADIRRTKARLLDEVPKLQRLAVEKIVLMFVDIVIAFHDCDSLKLSLHQVRVRIGSPITGYGQESRNHAARQRIPNRTWTDEDGSEHVEDAGIIMFGLALILNLIMYYLQINGSLARKAIRKLMFRRLITMVLARSNQEIYTRAINT
ncbi:unnamed protein product [Fraxinus pennsylvanica]|uniref:Mitochondrial import inner membrane translocase subunit Tim21 n=1 Tax=Fraxinus pennsylvanica TaxID=56036 RepID=A0AAD2AEA7_9LAMI|nr:unnamed protein product [Fraxinus pennsylvanica]